MPSYGLHNTVGIVGRLKEDGIHVLVSLRGKHGRLSVSTQDRKVVFELPAIRTSGDMPPPQGPWEFVVDASTTKLRWETDLHDSMGQIMGVASEEILVDLTQDPVLTNVGLLHDLYFPGPPGPSTNR